ncbi:MAG: CTP synthetase, partial [Halobacteriaceae archaeon]
NLAEALQDNGANITTIDGMISEEKLTAADIGDADIFILCNLAEATAIPVAKNINPSIQTVVYASDSLPEFVRAQLDLALDPELFTPQVVADELLQVSVDSPSN